MAKPRATLQVFLVDDSVLVRAGLAELLSTLVDVTVCGAAGSVAEALPAIRTGRPDVVILDLDLPDGSGLEVLQAVRQMPVPPVVIVLTIYPFKTMGAQCLAAGAACYLEKGGRIERLIEVLDELKGQPQAGEAPTIDLRPAEGPGPTPAPGARDLAAAATAATARWLAPDSQSPST